jgi:hypothetical protein
MDPQDRAADQDRGRATRDQQSRRTGAARHGLVLASATSALGATVAIGLTIPSHASAGTVVTPDTGSTSTQQPRHVHRSDDGPGDDGPGDDGPGDDGSGQRQQQAPQPGGLAGTGGSGPVQGHSSGS